MNTPAETAAPTNGGNGNRSRVLRIVTAAFLVLALLGLAWWKLVLSVRETTTDAYVAGNTMTVSAAISGTVVAVNAEDTQAVHAGDVLVQLDAADAQTGLDSARGTLAAAVAFAYVTAPNRLAEWQTNTVSVVAEPPPSPASTVAAALGYLDFRHEGKWRKGRPRLVAWLDEFAKAVSAFEKTRPVA